MTPHRFSRRRWLQVATTGTGGAWLARGATLEALDRDLVLIPAGPFLMGTTAEEARALARQHGFHPSWLDGELPRRQIDLPEFRIDRYPVTNADYPESIGDAARPVWYGGLQPTWERLGDGAWLSRGQRAGELSYELTVTPAADFVETRYRLTNQSDRRWEQSLAFNCVQCGSIPAARDHECRRTWVRHQGELRRLIELPRVFGPRPTIQLYSVEGAPLGRDIPFVANFRATPEIVVDGWLAVQSRDEGRLVATVSRPALFLFQNMEYGCIHCANGFGPLDPGQTGVGLNRVYFVESTLESWRQRLQAEWA